MSIEKDKDNPQVHLLAAKCCEQIREIWNNSQDNNEQKEIEILLKCIRFFAHYIKYLPECNNDVLNMCRFYMFLFNKKSVTLDLVVINRLVGICTTMIIRRRDDEVIRSTCNVLRDILEIIPSDVLNSIVIKYSKTVSFIFQKIYLVQTYYTQLRILDIFIYITTDLKDLRNDMIKKNKLMVKADQNILNAVYSSLDLINTDDMLNTSRKFLKFFNNNLFPKAYILAIEGRITKVNGHSIKQTETILVHFNGRNLTVSLFVPKIYFDVMTRESQTQQSNQKDKELMFIELECAEIHAEKKAHKEKQYIDTNIEVQQAKTYNGRRSETIDQIKSFSLRLFDDEFVVKRFMDEFYEKFKTKEKMMNENASLIDDKESVMTFQTSLSMINDLNINLKELQTQQVQTQNVDVTDDDTPKRTQSQAVPKAIVKNENVNVKMDAKTSELNLKTRPVRQRTKVNYSIYDEDNIDNDSEIGDVFTSYRDFKSQQLLKKTAPTAKDEDYSLHPVEIVTKTTTRKSKTPKINPKAAQKPKTSKINPKAAQKPKTQHYETDDEKDNQSVKKGRRGRKPKVTKNEENKDQQTNSNNNERNAGEVEQVEQAKAQLNAAKKAKTLTEKNYNIPPERIETNIKTATNKIPYFENKPLNTSESDNYMDISEDPIEPVPPKKQKCADDSFGSENLVLNESFNQLKATKPPKQDETKKIIPDGIKQVPTMKRKFDDIKEPETKKPKLTDIPEKSNNSKVEEWLQSTSDSFDLFENEVVAPETSAAKNETQVDEDGSDYSEEMYANDEHQHYSSSSQTSIDLDEQKTQVQQNKPAVGTNESEDSQISTQNDDEPINRFQNRIDDIYEKLIARKKKLDEKQNHTVSKYDAAISENAQKYAEQIEKINAQLKITSELYLKYEASQSQLLNEVNKQDQIFGTIMSTIEKRRKAQAMYQQLKNKELLDIKIEAQQNNERILKDAWSEYVDSVQENLKNSFKKSYEI